MKAQESYIDLAKEAIKEVKVEKSGDKGVKKSVDEVAQKAINQINEIIKRIKSGSITPQQAESETHDIVIAVSETPGLSKSSIDALRKAAAKEDTIAEAQKITNETSPGPMDNNIKNSARTEKEPEKSKLSDLIQRIKDLANKMMSRFTVVTTESPELGRLHPEPTPGKGATTKSKAKG